MLKPSFRGRPLLLVCGVALALATGCGPSASKSANTEQISAARNQFLLDTEPTDVVGVLDVQEVISEERDVVLVGRIGGVPNPWTPGKASFVVADPVKLAEAEFESEEKICDDPSCKFCARKKAEQMKEGVAVVEFLDPAGKILRIDARKLFELSGDETVVVRGRARVSAIGLLVVSADGLYVRR